MERRVLLKCASHRFQSGFDAFASQIDVGVGGDTGRGEESESRWVAAGDEAHESQVEQLMEHGLGRSSATVTWGECDHHAFAVGAAQTTWVSLCQRF